MKRLLFLAAFVLAITSMNAQNPDSVSQTTPTPVISLDAVGRYVGQNVKVEGKVYGVKQTGRVAFINMGAAFPNATLTLFIPSEHLKNFKDVSLTSYDGKAITVSGKIALYQNKPQIVLQLPAQIEMKQ